MTHPPKKVTLHVSHIHVMPLGNENKGKSDSKPVRPESLDVTDSVFITRMLHGQNVCIVVGQQTAFWTTLILLQVVVHDNLI